MGLRGNLVIIGITGGMTILLMKYLWSFLKQKIHDHPVQDQNRRNVNAGNEQRQVDHAGHPHAAMIRGQMITRQDIESRFFAAIARRMNELRQEHVNEFTQRAGLVNEDVAEIRNIKDILILMSSRDIIGPGNYNRILGWLQQGWFNHTTFNQITNLVQKLTQAVNELEDDININDPYTYDALIIHTENDRQAAIEFQNHLRRDIGVPNVRTVIYEEFHNGVMSEMRALETVFDRCRFIFVYVSQSFTRDDTLRYFEEMILTDSFYDDWKKFRIIPVWSTRERVRIIELNPLPGIKYWRFLDGERDVNSIYITSVRNLILNGRVNIPDPH